MKAGQEFNLNQVKALWALGEMQSPRMLPHYLSDLRAPGLLAQLGPNPPLPGEGTGEFRLLVEMYEAVRGRFLNMYFENLAEFVLELWSVQKLIGISAMGQMDPLQLGRFVPLLSYALSPAPEGIDKPQLVARATPLSQIPFEPELPIIVTPYLDRLVLVEGYTRSILFMRSALPESRIPVLVGHA